MSRRAKGPALWITAEQVADRFSVTPVTVWRWAREGDFPKPVRITSNCTRWRLSDIESFERKRVESPAEQRASLALTHKEPKQ